MPLIQDLQAQLGTDNVLTDAAECLAYGYDNSQYQGQADVVVFAYSQQDIVNIVKLCNAYQTPLYARGRGTATTGACVPTQRGLVLSLERMQTIKKIDPDNRVMVVEPGVLNKTVQDHAAKHGFFWAPDPSSSAYCSIGGNLSCNAAGPRAVKYGSSRENTLGLTAVTGSGDVLKTGFYTTKGAVAYDLARLLIGSEGTLAIITEATLKLTPKPEAIVTLRALYRDIQYAAAAVATIMAQAVTPCALEFMDKNALQLIRQHSTAPLPCEANALLLIEVDGPQAASQDMTTKISKSAKNSGLIDIQAAKTTLEVQQLWQARKQLSPILRDIAPKKINEDVVVPVANIPQLLEKLEALAAHYQIPIVNFGHAGNGNIHVNLLIDPKLPNQQAHANQCLDEIFAFVLQLNGSLSGEHGIGLAKRDFVGKQIDATALRLMRQIKQQFDPNHILNPGKVLP